MSDHGKKLYKAPSICSHKASPLVISILSFNKVDNWGLRTKEPWTTASGHKRQDGRHWNPSWVIQQPFNHFQPLVLIKTGSWQSHKGWSVSSALIHGWWRLSSVSRPWWPRRQQACVWCNSRTYMHTSTYAATHIYPPEKIKMLDYWVMVIKITNCMQDVKQGSHPLLGVRCNA